MRSNFSRYLVTACVGIMALSQTTYAEDTTTVTSASVASPAAVSSGKVMGGIDLRPSMTFTSNEFHTENMLELGYAFSPSVSLSGVYDFTTNIDDPTAPVGSLGLNPQSYDGFLRARLGEIAKLPGDISLTSQIRVYAPVVRSQRDKGFITLVRSYFNFRKELSSSVKLTLTELPILHVYSQPGAIGSDGVLKANPVVENRVYLQADFQITKEISLAVPILFHATLARDLAGASNSGRLSYFAWIYPELTYAINDNMAVAAAYYSDNLVAPDLSGTSFEKGLKTGVVQLSLQASL